MRRSNLAAAAFMVLSGTAVAQVSRTTDGKDVPYANQLPANTTMANGAGAASNTATANDTAPGGDHKTEAASPRR